jgi:23S rRNA (cytosine1962-C5)-methyltransferase
VSDILALLDKALTARAALFEAEHKNAFRIFNGFLEGCPTLAADIYATTLVLHSHANDVREGEAATKIALSFFTERLPWLRAGILKIRNSPKDEERKGRLLFGEEPDRKIRENGIWYAVDLRMSQDASLYLDTRNLRKWATKNLNEKNVLNTFAYTGSLGAAALAGGASRVVQLDLDRGALNLAKTTYTLNGFPIHKADFLRGDFFEMVSRLKRAGEGFDCVFLDPPFFSVTGKGVVDLEENMARLINKVRPLVNNGGWLVAVNNALYVRGKDYVEMLEKLCSDGYLQISELIPAPEDFSGYEETRIGTPITDPAPFNHSTKMAVMEVKKRDGKEASGR